MGVFDHFPDRTDRLCADLVDSPGLNLRAVGSRPSVARYAGARVSAFIMFAMVFSSALAGFARRPPGATCTPLKGDISVGYRRHDCRL